MNLPEAARSARMLADALEAAVDAAARLLVSQCEPEMDVSGIPPWSEVTAVDPDAPCWPKDNPPC